MSVCPVHPNRKIVPSKEGYTYNRNEPKNEAEFQLNPNKSWVENYEYNRNESKNQQQKVLDEREYYNYGYPSALYKRRQDNSLEEEKKFSGVY